MAFQLTPLQIPNMRTDYSAENSAFSNLGQTLGNMPSEFRKEQLNAQKQQILGQIGTGKLGYEDGGRALIALGDTTAGTNLLSLGQKQQQLGAQKGIADIFSGGGGTTPAAPVALGSPNEIESRFLGGVQKAGLTNPNGMAAVAAYGKSESGYSPGNVNKTWSDPSESGAAGTSGGIMSWRAERLQNLQNFARQRGEQGNGSPETQAAFLASEDPTLVPRLNAAKTPQEANQIMADAWRFAGYNRPGQGEFARREGLTGAYAQRYAGQPAAQPQQPVQVAENEADVQRLEAAQAARSAPPAQVAQSPDLPPQGANAAPAQAQGFAVPGNMLPPNDPYPRVTTQQLYGILQNPMASDGQRAMAKSIIDNRMKYSDENAPDKREQQRLATEQSRLNVEKTRRDVEGEGSRPMTPEERKSYNVPEGQAAYMKRNGDPGFGPAGTVIKNEPPPPAGMRYIRDAHGNIERMEPIPGSKAETEAKAAAEKQKKAEILRAEAGTVVGNALDDIDRLASSTKLPVTGAIGARLAGIPGTAAHDISQALSTIGANISFDKLQQMREASPTGGALGAVSDKEGELLKNSYAALSQSQSWDQFKTNLGRLRAIYERTIHGRNLTPQERKTGGPMTMERAKALRDDAAAAIAGGAPKDKVLERLKEYGISTGGL